MSEKNNRKHLNRETRKDIEHALDQGESVSAIAKMIGVPSSTIAREIKRNRKNKGYLSFSAKENHCRHKRDCNIRGLCGHYCTKRCASCKIRPCKDKCGKFFEFECIKLKSTPHCCNACPKRKVCMYRRFFYQGTYAHEQAKTRASESRQGINCTEEELKDMVKIVRIGLKKNQAFVHIWNTHGHKFPCSARTFYKYVENGNVDIASIELPKKVRYKPRKDTTEKRLKMDFAGRTYADYLALDEEVKSSRVEMDCVEGTVEDIKAILTLHFVRFSFQVMILLPKKTQRCVSCALSWVELALGVEFSRYIPLIVTDRGSEFLNCEAIETGLDGTKRTFVYYCDPQRPDQKAAAENNHRHIRKVVPKGTSFENLAQNDVSKIASHVNSYTRAHLGNSTPYKLASQMLPKNFFKEMGIIFIEPDEVTLNNHLLNEEDDI